MPRQVMLGPLGRMLVRWPVGLVLVSWHYMWRTMPLHRSEEAGDQRDLPPRLSPGCVDHCNQQIDQGTGALWHRTFRVRCENSPLRADELMTLVAADLNAAAPTEVAVFRKLAGRDGTLEVGDEYVVRMAAPWNGPVRVVDRSETSFRLATLQGHLECGQVEFRAERDGAALYFTIETWHRCASRLIDLLYTRLRLAKEIQLNLWVRYCTAVAKLAGDSPRGGVTICTRRLDGAQLVHASRERTGS